MSGYGGIMNGGGMWGMGLIWLLILIIVVFGIAALLKYFRD